MSAEPTQALTIGRLARAAGVGVETIRYYQERELLPVPESKGAFRYYAVELVDRIRFIKRAQDLGFALDEIGELLRLEDGGDRSSIRRIATARLQQIALKVADLRRMQRVLSHLVDECEHTSERLPCPIIGSLTARHAQQTPAPDVADRVKIGRATYNSTGLQTVRKPTLSTTANS